MKRLRADLARRHALDISSDCIMAYVHSRKGASAATIRYELAMLQRMSRLALRAGKVAHRPEFPTIEVRNARKGFFEAEDFERVVSHLPDDLQLFVRFAYLTGWRQGEIQGLTWRQVDLKAGVVRLEPGTTKKGEGRTFPFTPFPQLAELLRSQHDQTSAFEKAKGCIVPHVFHRRGEQIGSFRKAWVRIPAIVNAHSAPS